MNKVSFFIGAWSLIFLLLMGDQQGYAQSKMNGLVVDFESRQPIEAAQIFNETNKSERCSTNAQGEFLLLTDASATEDSIKLMLFAVGYKKTYFKVPVRPSDYPLMLYLVREKESYTEVTITAAPKVVYASDTTNVADYVFWGDSLLLLTYEKEERWKKAEEAKITIYQGCQLVLLDADRQVVQVASLPGEYQHFYHGHPDQIFLIGRTEKFWINSVDERLQLHRVADDDFSKIIEPIVAALPTHVIYSNYNPDFPAFEYYSYRTMDSSFQLLAHVEDEELMRMFRSEYKYLTPREKLEAYRYEQNTGVDKEVIAAYMRGFQNTYYYQPLNAPIFECHEQLVLFDHHHHCMKRITLNGSLVDSVAISFHMPKKPLRWSERVIQDKSQNHFYTTYERNGYTELHYIGDDGQHTHRMDLYYRYAEEVQIKNGFVYYIYRPFESSQNRYLYKEKIPATDKQ